MDQRQLGRSTLTVSTVCLGTNVFGWTIDQARLSGSWTRSSRPA